MEDRRYKELNDKFDLKFGPIVSSSSDSSSSEYDAVLVWMGLSTRQYRVSLFLTRVS